jgi:hypothetical protein
VPVNKPRKPRRPRSPQVFTDARKGVEAVARLERKYSAALKEAERIKREYERARARAGTVDTGRARRVPTPSSLFPGSGEYQQDELPFGADEDSNQLALPFDYGQRSAVPLDAWDTIQTPDDDDAPEVVDPFGPQSLEDPTATEYYAPTRSINPPRPRTREMSYNRQSRVLRVVYRDGGTYHYFNVPGTIWYRIRQVRSPGRFINRNILGQYEYERVTL